MLLRSGSKVLKYVLTATLLLCASLGVGNAAIIDVVLPAQPYTFGVLPNGTTLTFAKFDNTLGTLLSIEFITSVNGAAAGTVTNTDSKDITLANSTFEWDFTLSFPTAGGDIYNYTSPIVSLGNISLDTTAEGGHQHFPDLAQSATTNAVFGSDGIWRAAGSSSKPLSPITIANFQGAGPGAIDLQLKGESWFTTHASGGYSASFGSSADGTVQIKYTYENGETPEPLSLALVGSGLLGLGLIRRKRARQ